MSLSQIWARQGPQRKTFNLLTTVWPKHMIHSVKLSSPPSWCQIVLSTFLVSNCPFLTLGVKLSSLPPWCQIVLPAFLHTIWCSTNRNSFYLLLQKLTSCKAGELFLKGVLKLQQVYNEMHRGPAANAPFKTPQHLKKLAIAWHQAMLWQPFNPSTWPNYRFEEKLHIAYHISSKWYECT